MTEMIEKVARAIYPCLARAADFNGEGVVPWDELEPDDYLRDCAREAARAAIEALREPGPSVLARVREEIEASIAPGPPYQNWTLDEDAEESVWSGALDAVLPPTETGTAG